MQEALERGFVCSPEHMQMRQCRSRLTLQEMHDWLEQQRPLHPPRGPLGQAIGDALNNWQALTVFLDDVNVPPDNNASERAPRAVALGRKSFLFFGHEHAGANFAVLYTLVASCEAVADNPRDDSGTYAAYAALMYERAIRVLPLARWNLAQRP